MVSEKHYYGTSWGRAGELGRHLKYRPISPAVNGTPPTDSGWTVACCPISIHLHHVIGLVADHERLSKGSSEKVIVLCVVNITRYKPQRS